MAEVVNTSTLSKLYRTTTADIEKKLTQMGHKPVRTMIMASGRRFLEWDRKAVIEALDQYKQARVEMLQKRDQMRREFAEKQDSIPRTGYGSDIAKTGHPKVDAVISDAHAAGVPAVDLHKLLSLMESLQAQVQSLQAKLDEKNADDAQEQLKDVRTKAVRKMAATTK